MISRQDWSHWSLLLDQALDLAEPERSAWLQQLREQQPDAAAAVQRLLGHSAPDAEVDTRITDPGPLPAMGQYAQWLKSALLPGGGLAGQAAVPGQTFGPWQVSRRLGSGGMGEVWLATRADRLFQGQAAIKLLAASGDARQLGARFARERNLLARLAHPGIARLLDAGVSGGQPYLVLEYIEGQSLLDHAAAHAPTVATRLQLVIAIGHAVEYAHSRLIVHRDLKPSNVIVTGNGDVKLLDFGIAALMDGSADDTGDGSLTRVYGRGLTLDYASPEQITGEATGVGCDVYSLGVMLFELLTGRRPFHGAQAGRTALEYAVLHQPPLRLAQALRAASADQPSLLAPPLDAARRSSGLELVLAKALQKSPEDRYPTMAAFVADLERWLEHRPVLAARPGWRRRSLLWLRRNRLAAVLSAAVMLSLLGGLLAALMQGQRLAREVEKTAAIQGFLTRLLAAPDPLGQSGAEPSLRSVIDAGAARVSQEFAQRPDVELPLLVTLADTYINIGQYEPAQAIIAKGLSLDSSISDQPTAVRAKLLHRKGRILFELGQYPEAEALSREALAIQDRVLGPGSAESGETLMDLATALSLQGQARESMATSRHAIQVLGETLGADHPTTNLSRYNHALVLLRGGELEEAIATSRDALRIAQATQGRDVGQVGCILQRLGGLLLTTGRYAEAEPVLDQAIANLSVTMPGQVFHAFALQTKARLLFETGRNRQGLPLMAEASRLFSAAVGRSGLNFYNTELQRAEMLAADGQAQAAMDVLNPVTAELLKKRPLQQSNAYVATGVVLLINGQAQAALAPLQQGLAIRRQMLPPSHYLIATTESRIALAHAALRDEQARALLQQSAAALARVFQPGHHLRRLVQSALDAPPAEP